MVGAWGRGRLWTRGQPLCGGLLVGRTECEARLSPVGEGEVGVNIS